MANRSITAFLQELEISKGMCNLHALIFLVFVLTVLFNMVNHCYYVSKWRVH